MAFFSEEKNQKTFTTLSRTPQAAPGSEFAKVFCFFSSEKKTFLLSMPRIRAFSAAGAYRCRK